MYTEVRSKELKGFSDLLEYFSLVDDGVVLMTTGTLVAGFEFRGPDMDAMSVADAFGTAKRIAARMTMGSGWTLATHLIRSEHLEYTQHQGHWPDDISWLIEQERIAQFTTAGVSGHRLSRYFLTIAYEPRAASSQRAAQWFFAASDDDDATSADRNLAYFNATVAELEGAIRGNLPILHRLKSFAAPDGTLRCKLLQLIRLCTTGKDFPFTVPERPVYLSQFLADDFLGGSHMHLGAPSDTAIPGKDLAVLAIDGFPDRSFAGILRALDSIAVDFRFCATGELMGRMEAVKQHEADRKRWKSKKTPEGAQLTGRTVSASEIDYDAVALETDAGLAKSAVAHGRERSMLFSGKVILMDSDARKLAAAVGIIDSVIRDCGFMCRLESLNAVAAWLATFPGMHKRDSRKNKINTHNYAHMMPLSAPFRGHEHNPSPYFPKDSPPLLYAVTSGGTPYRFNPYVIDVGHVLVDGPSGGGKSTFLGLNIASFLRYENSQVVVFDKKRTLYTLCRALGGSWYNLSPDGSSSSRLCPLQNLKTDGQRKLATQIIELLVTEAGLSVTPDISNEIRDAIDLMAGGNGERSLTAFCMAVADESVADAMEVYRDGILDGDYDNLSFARLTMFEMDELYRLDKKTMNGALFTLFARVRDRFSSSIPTLVCVDEFREALEHPYAAHAFGEFLMEGRKLNAAVFPVLQELSKTMDSPLKTAILESCMTRVLLPNPQAIAAGADAYKALGLTDLDREIIAEAQPKEEYYVTSPDGKRLISLELGRVAMAFITASSDRDRARVDHLAHLYPDSWQSHWLRERGVNDWADLLDEVRESREKETTPYLCATGD
jgi:type IV secretion/conjugal transfer VirB4 family ATPase